MIPVTGLLLMLILVWLSRPPRDSDRRALLVGVLLATTWFAMVGISYGVPVNLYAPRFQWLILLSLAGAPLVVLLVWSAVTLLTRPRASRDETGDPM